MPKSTLLLVHGMGKPTDDMFNTWEAKLKNIYEQYSGGELFEDRFDCVRIEYDSIFEARRKTWKDQIDTILNSGITSVEMPSAEDLENVTEDNFFTTHLLDILLYRWLDQVAEHVRSHVIDQINNAVQRAHSSSKISIIAHSLGTSVIHDAVNAMYNTPDSDGNTLSPGNFRFHTIAMLANVSRTLETRWDAYDSLVKPGCDNSDSYVTDSFISVSHEWDPLAALRKFAPVENWPNPETVAKERVQIIQPKIISKLNVHSFSHYLDNPSVNVPLFKMLRHKRFVSKQEQQEALRKYMEANPIEAFDTYRRELKKILVGEADFSWKRLVKIFTGFQKIVNDFRK